ncbi:MAG: APC family permease [Steroidobacteraceae bacterium]|jgi:amino acid transporter
MTSLASRLRLPEAVGLSLSVISPTVTAAFNITLVVQAVGEAAPLVFVIGMVAMALVALSFMAFTHRVAHAGSAYAYISHTFGSRAGFITGWTLLLTYLGFSTGFAALVGNFTCAALRGFGIEAGNWWIAIGAGGMVLAWWLAYRDMRLAGRLMLLLEGIAIIAIVGLCISILHQVHLDIGRMGASFHPTSQYNGWVGVGFGMVFSILSFSGFEGAATLGEETINPRRNIPIALLGTVLGSGVFFVFVAYCEVAGYGPQGIKDLAASQAPLDDLALRFGSPRLAILLDLAAAVSCFSGIIGGLAAAGRILFALNTSTIGVLALILIYVGVGAAETVEAWRERRAVWAGVCTLGPVLLLWVLYRNIYPVPEFPNNLWPYFAFVWAIASLALIRLRPGVAVAPLPHYS